MYGYNYLKIVIVEERLIFIIDLNIFYTLLLVLLFLLRTYACTC